MGKVGEHYRLLKSNSLQIPGLSYSEYGAMCLDRYRIEHRQALDRLQNWAQRLMQVKTLDNEQWSGKFGDACS